MIQLHQTRQSLGHRQSSSVLHDASVLPFAEERFAVLAHEIRNPLSALNFALEAWPTTLDDRELVDELVQIMRRQVAQLTHLCNEMLSTTHGAAPTLAVRPSAIDAVRVIESACEEIRPLFAQCGQTLSVDIQTTSLTILGDESKLTQVFANLLHNAAKFTDRDGHIFVTLAQDEGSAIVRVSDNGCGMSDEDLREVFEARDATKPRACRPGCGRGIGLRLAKSIVELHGGTIRVTSDGEGHGSTFIVTLPLAPARASRFTRTGQQDGAPVKPRAVAALPPSPLPRYRVVVVDDDRSMRFLMTRFLTSLEQSVTVAANGEAALEAIIETRPHVVFMDLQLQGANGFQVAHELRKRAEFNHVVLIAISGSADSASRRLASQSGFDHYLTKPTSMAAITEALVQAGSIFGV